MKYLSLLALLLASPLSAQEAALQCMGHDDFARTMASDGFVITMAEMVQDGTDRRLEAWYHPKECRWTLAIVQMSKGKVTGKSRTCLLGEGDPGVCIPQK